jgi:hypothetical protein
MEFFRIRRVIPFMRHALAFNIISLVVFALSVGFLVFQGLHFSIEFTGGTVMEVSYKDDANPAKIREALGRIGLTDVSVQTFGTSKDVLIRLPLKTKEGSSQNVEMQKQADAVMGVLKTEDKSADLKRVEFVGSQVGKELATDGGLALLFVCFGIVIYLAFRFEWRFTVATIIAHLHDVVIILGFFALFQCEFSLPVLAAVLAVVRLLGERVGGGVRPRAREFPQDAQGDGARHHGRLDHRRDLAHHHHPLVHADDGPFDLLLRRREPALLRAGADHRDSLRHLLVGAGRVPARDVPRRFARGLREAGEEGREQPDALSRTAPGAPWRTCSTSSCTSTCTC